MNAALDERLVVDAHEDLWAPRFEGNRLCDIQQQWLTISAKTAAHNFQNLPPVQSIALVGAVRSRKTWRLSSRDEYVCSRIMDAFLSGVEMSPVCTVDLFNLTEDRDIFKAKRTYDLAIFCNLRDITQELSEHYWRVEERRRLSAIMASHSKPVGKSEFRKGRNLDAAVRDALKASDVLTGQKYTNIAPEHKHFLTVSRYAFDKKAYQLLARRLQCRFILSWGFQQYVNSDHFTKDSFYNLNYRLDAPEGARLRPYEGFTAMQDAHANDCIFESSPIPFTPGRFPDVQLSARNDILEHIANNNAESSNRYNPLFKGGLDLVEKMNLHSRLRQRHGRKPVSKLWWVAGRSLEMLQEEAAQPPDRLARAELYLRQKFGLKY